MNNSTPAVQVSVDARCNRATRRFALSRRRQRKGQALILAVLIMLMVAVLSAGFLVVVSGNLNQTARVTDKTRAVESARSGLKFVNDQLTYSQLGENWRPGFLEVKAGDTYPGYTAPVTQPEASSINRSRTPALLAAGESLIPPASDPSRSIYYSSVDQANGWAGTFAKFPDPFAPRSDAPQYLTRVQLVSLAPYDANNPSTLEPTDSDRIALTSGDVSKAGMLRITVIGLSNDDPAAFSKVVAYKGGQNSPIGRFARVVGNWDFKNKTVPVGQAGVFTAAGVNPAQLPVNNVQGAFPLLTPFTVMIGNPGTGTPPLCTAVVQNVLGTASNPILILAADPARRPQQFERVEVAAQLGASAGIGVASPTQSQISYSNDGNFTNTNLTVSQPAPQTATAAQSGSVFANGSVSFAGTLLLQDLVPQSSSNPYYSSVRASGLMLRDATSPSVSLSTRNASGAQGTASQLALTSNKPGSLLGTSVTDKDADPLVSDGFNRLNNDPSSYRQTKPFSPPDISSSAGAARYRQLTRDSAINTNSIAPAVVANPSDAASNYGYGQGIYINNPSDRERVYNPTTSKLRDMTQAELEQMWLSRQADGVTEDRTQFYNRTGKTPAMVNDPIIAPANVATASLEEQHLRGWVAPDEFHARGALVELFNEAQNPAQPPSIGNPIVAKVAITLDSRADNTSANTNNALGPVVGKAWAKPDGNPTNPYSSDPGVYRKVFNWPANGVISAEGNIRVRGEIDASVGAAPRSLTIVSQNNIYIDGSLDAAKNFTSTAGATPPKVLLLAKRNVIVNPTQAIFHPESQTLATPPAAMPIPVPAFVLPTPPQQPTPVTVPVADTSDFKKGDVIETLTPATLLINPPTLNAVGVITAVDPINKTLDFVPVIKVATSISLGDIVRIRAENTVNGRAVIGSLTDAIQRRFQVSDLPPNPDTNPVFRLTFDHSASQVKALAVSAEADTGFNNSADPVIWDFKRTVDPSGNAIASEKLARAVFTSPATGSPEMFPAAAPSDNATANGPTQTLAAISAAMIAKASHTDVPTMVSWKYNATPIINGSTTYAQVPFHYLAALRNRQTFGAPAAPAAATPHNVDIRVPPPPATPYSMLLATSIDPLWSGQPVALRGFDAAPDLAHSSFFFGFCPDYTEITYQSPQVAEDGLTGDEPFYSSDPNQTTLDSRIPYGLATPIVPLATPVPLVQTPGIYSLSLHEPAGVVGISDDPITPAPLPQYRFGHLKMEYLDTNSTSPTYKQVTPGYTMNIHAFVYAQTGSWFVVPNALFNKLQFKGTNITPTASVFDAAESKDFNRNGVDTDAGEANAFLRYSRANYKINFFGAIAENQTAIINPVGTVPGAVQAWSNDWANYTENNNSGTITLANTQPGVIYTFDPSYANNPAGLDAGFVMPQSDQLTYIE